MQAIRHGDPCARSGFQAGPDPGGGQGAVFSVSTDCGVRHAEKV